MNHCSSNGEYEKIEEAEEAIDEENEMKEELESGERKEEVRIVVGEKDKISPEIEMEKLDKVNENQKENQKPSA